MHTSMLYPIICMKNGRPWRSVCNVFTGGIGENSATVRWKSCLNMERLGISVDDEKNGIRQKEIMEIQAAKSLVTLLVIPTDEEYEIARQTLQVINNSQVSI